MKIVRAFASLALAFVLSAGAVHLSRWSKGDWRFALTRMAFTRALDQSASEIVRETRTGRSNVYYFTSYYLHGMLSAYEATGDEKLLERTLLAMDEMLARARPYRAAGKEFRVWGPFGVNAASPIPRPDLHFTFQAAVPLARAAAMIRSDPKLEKLHGARADRYAWFVDQLVFGYFLNVQLEQKIPWLDPDSFPLWNDNASNLALNAAFLCRAGGEALHCEKAVEIGQAFKAKLSPYRTGWIWENRTIPIGSDTDNTPGSLGNQAGVPDTSHTNREAFLMLTLAEMGLVFGREDVDRMAASLADRIWNGSLDLPSFANYLNGSDKPYRVYKDPGLNGSIYHGWALMGGHNPKAQQAMLAALKAIYLGKSNPSLERNTTSYGALVALSGHTLRNFNPPPLAAPAKGEPTHFARMRR